MAAICLICREPAFERGLCTVHYRVFQSREKPPVRLEITTNDREWFAEQGRTLDERALLSRRMPLPS